MPKLTSIRLALVALLGFVVAACDLAASLSGPTDQYVLQADIEAAAAEADDGESAEDVVARSMEVVERRLDALGIYVHETNFMGDGRVMIRTSGDQNSEGVFASVGTRAKLEIRVVDDTVLPQQLEMGIAPPGREVFSDANGFERLAVLRLGGIRGDRIIDARTSIDPYTNETVINIRFDERGGEQFERMSTDNVGNRIAILIDDVVMTAPIVSEPILGGQVQISGSFEGTSAEQLAAMLQAGSLPVTFDVLEERTID